MLLYADEHYSNYFLYNVYGMSDGHLQGNESWSSLDLYKTNNKLTLDAYSDIDSIITYLSGTPVVGMFIQALDEIMFITDIDTDLYKITVIRATYNTEAVSSTGNIANALTSSDKVRSLRQATTDILQYHNVKYTDYLYLTKELQDVALNHAFNINNYSHEIDTANRVNIIAKSGYNDGVLSLDEGGGTYRFSANIKAELDDILKTNGVDNTKYWRR